MTKIKIKMIPMIMVKKKNDDGGDHEKDDNNDHDKDDNNDDNIDDIDDRGKDEKNYEGGL